MAKLRNSLATKDAAGALGSLLEKALTQWLIDTQPSDLWQTCLTCYNWNDKDQICKHYNAKPPAKVIVGQVDCQKYSDGEQIPF